MPVDQPSPTLRVDFQNADAEGRVRLNTVGALDDIAALGKPLFEGHTLRLVDGELHAHGVAAFSHSESIWTAVVDWKEVSASAT